MKISRNFAMGATATIVYFAAIIMIWSQLSGPIKIFMDSEAGQFWSGVIFYAFTLFLAVVMPIFCVQIVFEKNPKFASGDRWFMFGIGVVMTLVAYPLVAHAISTVSDTGLNLVQFKQSVVTTVDSKSNEPNWYGLWYRIGLFVYGFTTAIALFLGLAICVMIAVMRGWGKAIELVVNFPEEDKQ